MPEWKIRLKHRRFWRRWKRNCLRKLKTALLLAEGYLLLLHNSDRASHHAALALTWAEEEVEQAPELVSRAHTLMARALLAANDTVGGVWRLGSMSPPRLAWRWNYSKRGIRRRRCARSFRKPCLAIKSTNGNTGLPPSPHPTKSGA